MKSRFLIPFFSIIIIYLFLLTGCKDWVLKEIEIKYEVIATSTDRPLTIYYANDINGEDIVRDTTTLYWEKTYIMESDTALERLFTLYVICYEDYTNNSSQTITTRIFEDGDIFVEQTSGGTATIGYDKTNIWAWLPSKVRWEEK